MIANARPSGAGLLLRAAFAAFYLCSLVLVQAGPVFAAEPQPSGDTSGAPPPETGSGPLAPPISKVPVPKKRIDAEQPRQGEDAVALLLEVTYVARLLVPEGSELTVDAFDKDGKAIASTKVTTPDSDATIPVELEIGGEPEFPLRIEATLKSGFGHLLTGTRTVEAQTADRIKLALKVVDGQE